MEVSVVADWTEASVVTVVETLWPRPMAALTEAAELIEMSVVTLVETL